MADPTDIARLVNIFTSYATRVNDNISDEDYQNLKYRIDDLVDVTTYNITGKKSTDMMYRQVEEAPENAHMRDIDISNLLKPKKQKPTPPAARKKKSIMIPGLSNIPKPDTNIIDKWKLPLLATPLIPGLTKKLFGNTTGLSTISKFSIASLLADIAASAADFTRSKSKKPPNRRPPNRRTNRPPQKKTTGKPGGGRRNNPPSSTGKPSTTKPTTRQKLDDLMRKWSGNIRDLYNRFITAANQKALEYYFKVFNRLDQLYKAGKLKWIEVSKALDDLFLKLKTNARRAFDTFMKSLQAAKGWLKNAYQQFASYIEDVSRKALNAMKSVRDYIKDTNWLKNILNNKSTTWKWMSDWFTKIIKSQAATTLGNFLKTASKWLGPIGWIVDGFLAFSLSKDLEAAREVDDSGRITGNKLVEEEVRMANFDVKDGTFGEQAWDATKMTFYNTLGRGATAFSQLAIMNEQLGMIENNRAVSVAKNWENIRINLKLYQDIRQSRTDQEKIDEIMPELLVMISREYLLGEPLSRDELEALRQDPAIRDLCIRIWDRNVSIEETRDVLYALAANYSFSSAFGYAPDRVDAFKIREGLTSAIDDSGFATDEQKALKDKIEDQSFTDWPVNSADLYFANDVDPVAAITSLADDHDVPDNMKQMDIEFATNFRNAQQANIKLNDLIMSRAKSALTKHAPDKLEKARAYRAQAAVEVEQIKKQAKKATEERLKNIHQFQPRQKPVSELPSIIDQPPAGNPLLESIMKPKTEPGMTPQAIQGFLQDVPSATKPTSSEPINAEAVKQAMSQDTAREDADFRLNREVDLKGGGYMHIDYLPSDKDTMLVDRRAFDQAIEQMVQDREATAEMMINLIMKLHNQYPDVKFNMNITEPQEVQPFDTQP